jgi:acyl-coenzyme A synthetase/AMP-(fatty) acid ligase
MDRMVKVRGYRIELDEVEASLAAHPGLTGAVVIAHETSTGARLAAFAVPRGTEPTVRELKAFLAGTLPDYMIPHTWRRIDALPLTPNGKLDRDSLRPTVPGPQRLPGVALADG